MACAVLLCFAAAVVRQEEAVVVGAAAQLGDLQRWDRTEPAKPECGTLAKTTQGAAADAAVKLVCENWPARVGPFPAQTVEQADLLYRDVFAKGALLDVAKQALAAAKAEAKQFCWRRLARRPRQLVGGKLVGDKLVGGKPEQAIQTCPEISAGAPMEVPQGTFGVVPKPERHASSLFRLYCWKDCLDVCGTDTRMGPRTRNFAYPEVNSWSCACIDPFDESRMTEIMYGDAVRAPPPPQYIRMEAAVGGCAVGTYAGGACHDACPAEMQEVKIAKSWCHWGCKGAFPYRCGLACAADASSCRAVVFNQIEAVITGTLETAAAVFKVLGNEEGAALATAVDEGVVQSFYVLREVAAAVRTAASATAGTQEDRVVAVLVALLHDLAGPLGQDIEGVATYVENVMKVLDGQMPEEEAVDETASQRLAGLLQAKRGPERVLEAFYAPRCA